MEFLCCILQKGHDGLYAGKTPGLADKTAAG